MRFSGGLSGLLSKNALCRGYVFIAPADESFNEKAILMDLASSAGSLSAKEDAMKERCKSVSRHIPVWDQHGW